jgi:cyclase
MVIQRVIPILLVSGGRLVKTTRFSNPVYIGDPLNTLRIFNRLEADEVCFLDIDAARRKAEPPLHLIRRLSVQAFMPLAYGGGITRVETGQAIVEAGVEKLVLGAAFFENPAMVEKLASKVGVQSVMCALDFKSSWSGKRYVVLRGATRRVKMSPEEALSHVQSVGAGEIILTDVDREGTWRGLDLDFFGRLLPLCRVPVIVHGGVSDASDAERALAFPGVSAVGVGNLCIYQKKGAGILINYPPIRRHRLSLKSEEG